MTYTVQEGLYLQRGIDRLLQTLFLVQNGSDDLVLDDETQTGILNLFYLKQDITEVLSNAISGEDTHKTLFSINPETFKTVSKCKKA